MLIIIVTVVIQGALTPREERGSFSGPLLTINSGIFQAIGVISFGRCNRPPSLPLLNLLRESPFSFPSKSLSL